MEYSKAKPASLIRFSAALRVFSSSAETAVLASKLKLKPSLFPLNISGDTVVAPDISSETSMPRAFP